jgi:hypothetical protein
MSGDIRLQAETNGEAGVTAEAAHSHASRAIRIATLIFISLQFLDLLTTLIVFSHGGVELNPTVRALMPWTGKLWAVVISKATLVIVVLLLNRRIWLVRFGNILYTCVVAWNIWIICALHAGV